MTIATPGRPKSQLTADVVLRALRQNHFAVLSTVGADGTPHSAGVNYGISDSSSGPAVYVMTITDDATGGTVTVVLHGVLGMETTVGGAARQGRRSEAIPAVLRGSRTPHGGDRRPSFPVGHPVEGH